MIKPRNLFAIILLLFIASACKKQWGGCDPANMNGSMSLSGKWQVVRDSTSNSMIRTVPAITNYIGVAGDYFDFRADGFCYTKEGNAYDTLSYRQLSSQSVDLQNFGLNVNGSIEPSILTHSSNTATITTQNILSPGGTIFREVNLKR